MWGRAPCPSIRGAGWGLPRLTVAVRLDMWHVTMAWADCPYPGPHSCTGRTDTSARYAGMVDGQRHKRILQQLVPATLDGLTRSW